MARSTPVEVTHDESEPTGFVTKDELNAFGNNLIDKVGEIVKGATTEPERPVVSAGGKADDKPVASAMEEAQGLVELAKPENANGFLPPQFQRIFERYFDPEDGFEASMTMPDLDPKTGSETGGMTFNIFVPEKFSNMSPAHKTFYKVDNRTRVLMPSAIAKGIDDWCKRVALNIKYNKKVTYR